MSEKYPGIPEPAELTGCTFMGRQLSAQEIEERDRRSQAMEDHRKTIDGNVILLRKHIKATGREPETKRVSKRAHRFSTKEIRKEYGIMNKPYESKIENILWCILNKGPVELKDIAKILEYTDPKIASRKLSGPISNMHTCLGQKEPYGVGWIVRETDGGRYFYKAVDQTRSVEVMYDKYCEINKIIWRDRQEKRKQRVKDLAADRRQEREEDKMQDQEERKTKPVGNDELSEIDNSMANSIMDIIAKGVSKRLGIQVEISHKIEILFGIKERE